MSLQVPSSLKSLQAWTGRHHKRIKNLQNLFNFESYVPSSEAEPKQSIGAICRGSLRCCHGAAVALPADTDQTLVGVRPPTSCSTVAVTAVAGLGATAPLAALLSALQLRD